MSEGKRHPNSRDSRMTPYTRNYVVRVRNTEVLYGERSSRVLGETLIFVKINDINEKFKRCLLRSKVKYIIFTLEETTTYKTSRRCHLN